MGEAEAGSLSGLGLGSGEVGGYIVEGVESSGSVRDSVS